MSDAAVLGIVGIIVSGVLGPAAAAWWSARRQAADQRHEMRQEHRDVIDDAVRYIGRAQRVQEELISTWRAGHAPSDPEGQAASQAIMGLIADVRFRRDRLRIRLGRDHPISKAYGGAAYILDTQIGSLVGAFQRGESEASHSDAISKVLADYRQQRKAFLEAARDYLDPTGT